MKASLRNIYTQLLQRNFLSDTLSNVNIDRESIFKEIQTEIQSIFTDSGNQEQYHLDHEVRHS